MGTGTSNEECLLILLASASIRSVANRWADVLHPDNAVRLRALCPPYHPQLIGDEDLHMMKVRPIELLQVNDFLLQEEPIDFNFDRSQLAEGGLNGCFAFLRTVG